MLSVYRSSNQHSSETVTAPAAGAFTLSWFSLKPVETTETRVKQSPGYKQGRKQDKSETAAQTLNLGSTTDHACLYNSTVPEQVTVEEAPTSSGAYSHMIIEEQHCGPEKVRTWVLLKSSGYSQDGQNVGPEALETRARPNRTN